MHVIKEQDWKTLPEQAQQEVYDFYLFIKQRYEKSGLVNLVDQSETQTLSNHSANTIDEWLNETEDNVWK